ncbi:E3 ubiquitin-protein ligase SH3RF1-like isoform X1 [Octopus vulgaris]|nr:E3 ubiquitin-protein ligase SH3RF1-like isoform X1 [Octopus vulgaris]
MDEQALNELLECSVCLERLDHTSKVLPCQHTFCRRCLEEIVSTKKELRCPECRTLVSYRVEDLPSNILLIRLLEGLKNANQTASTSTGPALRSKSSSSSTSSSSASRRHESLPVLGSNTKRQFEANALYSYEAKESGDLSFKKGDIITICHQVDQNWYHGKLDGQEGYFPSSYVQVVNNFNSTVPQVKALYDFDINDENEKDCLKFSKDEVLQLIRKVDDNWLEGRRGDKIGIFPTSFVELNEAAKLLVSSRTSRSVSTSSEGNSSTAGSSRTTSTPSPSARQSLQFQKLWYHYQQQRVALPPPSSTSAAAAATSAPPLPPNSSLAAMQKRHSFTATSHTHSAGSSPTIQQRRSLELSPSSGALPLNSPLHVTLPPPPAPASCSSSMNPAKLVPHLDTYGNKSGEEGKPSSAEINAASPPHFGKNVIYSALYNYKPQKDDEVELHKGDQYTVTEKCQDGWYKGCCLKTGISGVFPGNYVQISRSANYFGAAHSRTKDMPSSPSLSSDISDSPSSMFFSSPPPPCSGNADTPPPAPPPATVFQPHLRSSGSLSTSCTSSGTSSGTGPHRSAVTSTAVLPTRSRALHSTSSSAPSTSSSILAAAYSSSNNNNNNNNNNINNNNSTVTTTTTTTTTGTATSSRIGAPSSSSIVIPSMQIATNSTPESSSAKVHHSPAAAGTPASAKNSGASVVAATHHAQNVNPPRRIVDFAFSPMQHSMSATANTTTPPNVVAGLTPSSSSTHHSSKEKKEKKERDKPSLVKRLTLGKNKKTKSPSDAENTIFQVTPDTSHARYRCIAPYPPQGEMELELKIGDIVMVYKKWENGWYKGAHHRTGKNGLFPGSFVTKCD